MKNTSTHLPLSLYIHTPWCIRKCPYCDFNSHAVRGELPEKEYINALLSDLKNNLAVIEKRKIHSVFIGGGTPSLFSAKSYETLFTQLQQYLDFSMDVEITMEANPGTVEQSRFKDYRSIGINRLSLGIQSLQNEKLKILGRIHSSEEAIRAVDIAKNAGFDNFNVDIMHGLPEQTVQEALSDLKQALALTPTHLSWYQLTLEPNTYFHKFPPQLPPDDLLADIQDQGQQLLHDCGFEHYEVSAYTKPNHHCRHNINYWEFGDYIGIGAGAHSKLTDLNTGTITRHWNVKSPKDYLNPTQSFVANKKIITPQELPLEFMMNALRLQKPITIDLFIERTGLDLQTIKAPLTQAQDNGFLLLENNSLITTPMGKRYLNEVLQLFL
ncbi:radical SAM family heme chaperone HemW [Candidiatus Paracoxiella cheracis]|uniref:radical SAM family heme chaperone HemW n=1 Tax=Candidiatus Paracoxiella cheracis TaxID=3405120 RepID=UPI003BF53D69